MKRDLLTFSDWHSESFKALISLAQTIKTTPLAYRDALAGKSVVALFEKPSLRTRVSFDVGINKLGGHLVYLDSQANNLSGREDNVDVAANLACWADAIVARVYQHETLQMFAQASKVPVINALCDRFHPCQALADLLTLTEVYGDLKDVTVAYIGDGNNVTHSLMIASALAGCNVTVVTPKGYETDVQITHLAAQLAEHNQTTLTVSNDLQAAQGAQVLYTDTWLSMGDTTPLEQIKDTFMPYQINDQLMAATGAQYVMHCQPAHRDLEITGSLIDSQYSLLMQQAENRMHGQNAILVNLLAEPNVE
ncbi:ornithine carbamoyltransferase [Aestuariibacter salexigens]|uniref:ornithine carbamoyltransferase n=1 Tax=Aestuariibacter salexigens TaxID=226010 RepID=UPI0004276EAA|nr:ornithine carbamoyltransferase [Aestuariibacter salexigens]